MGAEDGWRGTQGISIFKAQHSRKKKKPAEKQNIQRYFSSAAPGVTSLPEMSDWHWEASLQAVQHSNKLEGRRLCREDNS